MMSHGHCLFESTEYPKIIIFFNYIFSYLKILGFQLYLLDFVTKKKQMQFDLF